MTRLGTLACAAALFAAPALAQTAPTPHEIASRTGIGAAVTAVGTDSFAGTAVSFPNGVKGMPDVTYQTLSGFRPLKMDIFLPPERYASAGPRPLIVYIHGGGWLGGGPRRSAAYQDWPRVLASFAERGYVVASVAYRFSGEAPFPAAIKDVKAGIRFLRANADKYNIDPDRVVTWGQSAGGQLSALVATSCGVEALSPAQRVVPRAGKVELTPSAAAGADAVSDCVNGAVAWFGVFDFATMPVPPAGSPPNPLQAFLGCKDAPCTAEQLKAASPQAYVGPKTPPLYLMHGEKDVQVPVAQSIAFKKALEAAGHKTELTLFPNSDHSWICPTPEETKLVSRTALEKSLAWVDGLIGDRAK